MAVTTHPHPASRLKKEYSYNYTPHLGLRGLFQVEIYLYFILLYTSTRTICLHGMDRAVFTLYLQPFHNSYYITTTPLIVHLSIVTYLQKCRLEGLTESRNASVTDTSSH
jgi:hypothetical protein